MINAISPIDGRYSNKTQELSKYFSEAALIKYRILVEIEYLIHLIGLGIIPQGSTIDIERLRAAFNDLNEGDVNRVKELEKTTNHDVKAVEYFIKETCSDLLTSGQLEFVHFGLTSQDVNNTALPLMLRDALQDVIFPGMEDLLGSLTTLSEKYKTIPLLARTHGQPASPTTVGKELKVFVERLSTQLAHLRRQGFFAKFGGATGNFNAHKLAFPTIQWTDQMDEFISGLGLTRLKTTTQIAHYDNIAECLQTLSRTNTIMIDLCQDIWTYISLNYFTQKTKAGEVGSSAMPHKVNPIDFENAEGNLGLANALLNFLSNKLPISRLQRDLTDSTVTRNVGMPLAHMLVAIKSIAKGLSKLEVNQKAINQDLEDAWAVVAEGIQTVLRREGFEKPYELLRDFSRGKGALTKADFEVFIDGLPVDSKIRAELKSITPHNYLGYATD